MTPIIGINRNRAGFTIVELLIVIIVIAILATISIVAYTGIQNRANDSAVQSDLNNLAKAIRMKESIDGSLPAGGSAAGNSTAFPGITFKVSKDAYDTSANNLFYCQGTKSSQPTFALTARSKSMAIFVYTPEGGLVRASSGSASSNCTAGWDGGAYSTSYGYNPSPVYLWFGWTNG